MFAERESAVCAGHPWGHPVLPQEQCESGATGRSARAPQNGLRQHFPVHSSTAADASPC